MQRIIVTHMENDQMSSLCRKCTYSDVWCVTGKPLQLHLQACDVKSKEEKSGPENMLTESSTGDGTTESI